MSKKSAIRYFGDYVLLGEIARGGMGVVYHALQTSLDREVAIKMLDGTRLMEESAGRRFQTEAEAMAKLDHPNIVTIYEVGEHDGQRYLSMKLIDGPNLAEKIAAQPLEPYQSVALLIPVARAVQYAHECGVLHRDLKPSNILIDSRGEPHITDFGIAKLLGRTDTITGSVATLGTPEYMAPEQAAGRTREATTAADIYSLGAVLYRLLTGQPPFNAETPLETLHHVVSRDPAPIRSLNPDVDADLDFICMKCLAKEPAQRYPSAGDLASELQRWLSHQPIDSGSFWKQCARRRPFLAASGAALLLVAAASLAGWLWHRSTLETWKLRSGSPPQTPPEAHPGLPPLPQAAPERAATGATARATPVAGTSTQPVPLVVSNVPPPQAEFVQDWQEAPEAHRPPPAPAKLVTRPIPNGEMKVAPSGQPREILERKADGVHTRYLSSTGRLKQETVRWPTGTIQVTYFKPNGRTHFTEETQVNGSKSVTKFDYDRDGLLRARESIRRDPTGLENSRITTRNGQELVRTDAPGRYGFVFQPSLRSNSPVFALWKDPGWNPATLTAPPFRFAWDWKDQGWYWVYRSYWSADALYRTPAHWLTDWMLASYAEDRYAHSVSPVQARADARLFRIDAAKAAALASNAQDSIEISEATAARRFAEQRAAEAEARALRAEAAEKQVRERAGRPGARETPIDAAIKDRLREQIEQAIAEARNGGAAYREPALLLQDSNHLWLVSRIVSVTSESGNPAGTLTQGDLLKRAPGQPLDWKRATETTFVLMRVLTSKGEEGEVLAGASVNVPLGILQDFENDFRATLELGLLQADQLKDRFQTRVAEQTP